MSSSIINLVYIDRHIRTKLSAQRNTKHHSNRLVSPRRLPLSPPSSNKDPAIGGNPRLGSNPLTDDDPLSRPSCTGPRADRKGSCLVFSAAGFPYPCRAMLADLGGGAKLVGSKGVCGWFLCLLGALTLGDACKGIRPCCVVRSLAPVLFRSCASRDGMISCSFGACECLARCCDL